MFRRILIANRGEAAARVVRTCERMGIESVAVASTVDQELSWLKDATRVVCIGGPHPRDSYLNQDTLLEVARRERCSAIHPAWGFLSENAIFAARCEAVGIRFIGPRPHVLARLGDKIRSREAARQAGLPLLPSTNRPLRDLQDALDRFRELGPPLLLKASAGGGGRGLVPVLHERELEGAWREAAGQVASAFGRSSFYLERLLLRARHVEFQVLADRFGEVLVLGTRDCSVQRRWQKLIEEAPASRIPPALFEELSPLVARFMRTTGYSGAGTIEMLQDEQGNLSFLECNARLQVEHPVTETLWGLDLVEQQIRVACGEPRPWGQATARPGHAIEARVNAEIPEMDFAPSPGRITALRLPSGPDIRVDTHLRLRGPAEPVPPHYDSLLAKVIAFGPDRPTSIARLRAALAESRVEGVHTNLALLGRILGDPVFLEDRHDTAFLEAHLSAARIREPHPEETILHGMER